MQQPPTYPQTVISHPILEAHLRGFVCWALQITASSECSGDTALALLEQAWQAQKLLWQLRDIPTVGYPVTHQ